MRKLFSLSSIYCYICFFFTTILFFLFLNGDWLVHRFIDNRDSDKFLVEIGKNMTCSIDLTHTGSSVINSVECGFLIIDNFLRSLGPVS
mgnify:CR=1 FL=1